MASDVGSRETRLAREVESLQAEVLRLHRKLEEYHVSDYNSLRRAYVTLSQHVAALEQEARNMTADLERFETQAVPPQLVAQEVGMAAAITCAVGVLHTTVRALPVKSGLLIRGMWLLGGAVVVMRLTGGTLAHVAGMFQRNSSRKRRLKAKLAAVEERIRIMAALQTWAEKREGPSADEEGAPPPAPAAAAEPDAQVAPPRRVSPATSSGSSAELVEMPQAQELEEAEAAAAAEAGQRGRSGSGSGNGPGAGAGAAAGQAQGPAARTSSSGAAALQSLLAYAELGKKQGR